MLLEAVVFLAAAVVAVPLSRLLGLGAIIGYLAAGVAIGPWGFGLVGGDDPHAVESTLHFAEFGVVLLLFVIGLELAPRRLWSMRKPVFGMGSAQILISAGLIAAAAVAFGVSVSSAIVIGLVLGLSSTAFALQMLAEKEQLTAQHGRASFAILLMQDLAVIPLLALIPLFGAQGGDGFSLVAALQALGVIVGIIVVGRYALRPVLRIVAQARINEIFTALALLVVTGTALLADWAGLSMALGAFLAGVLLADSEYRHALEADIEPFKGLLLGLFFIAVGMGVNIGLLASQPLQILGIVVGLMAVKFAVLYGLGRLNGLSGKSSRALAATLAQGGEFAFVLFEVARQAELVDSGSIQLLIVAVTLSMALTPIVFALNERLWQHGDEGDGRAFDMPDEHTRVIIAGFGRFGQIVARVLNARKERFTALERNPSQVDFVRRFGNETHFGDASRPELLRAAGIEEAELFVLAIQEHDASLAIAKQVLELNPDIRIIARARNRPHAYDLMDLGIRDIVRDTFDSSVRAAGLSLRAIGYSNTEADRTTEAFTRIDEERLFESFGNHDDLEKMVEMAKESRRELERLFEQDSRSAR